MTPHPSVVAAPDKFRGSATAGQVAAAVAAAVESIGGTCEVQPMADGGEGLLDVFGGPNRNTVVTGPLGDPVEAPWRRNGRDAVVEMARASGLALVGGASGNDAVAASTWGTGELITAAVDAGCRRVLVGLGGSATTDGGLGALRALEPHQRLRPIELVVACDVETQFLDAAREFSAQKGASSAQVTLLSRRLERLAQVYEEQYDVDVRDLAGGGAAGGLAGGLACVGASLVAGFDVVAAEVDLAERLVGADLVVTGEGHLDRQSFEGKVVGGVADLAAEAGVEVLAVVGGSDPDVVVPDHVTVVSLSEQFGESSARADTLALVTRVVAQHLEA